MRKYLLDTDTIINYLKGDEAIFMRIDGFNSDDVCTSIINEAELKVGLEFMPPGRKRDECNYFLREIDTIGLDSPAIDKFAQLKGKLLKKGLKINDMDILIAAITIVNGCVLVTRNLKHFRLIPGLKLEDWSS